MSKNITTEDFISRARKIHGVKYNYTKVVYTKTHDKVIIECPLHGIFEQELAAHLQGQGCPMCGRIKASNKLRAEQESFIKRSKIIHNDKYNYLKVKYKNSNTKVCIICPKHGEFFIQPNHHLEGCGCQKCKREENGFLKRSNTDDFIKKARKIHGEKYDYSKVNYIKASQRVCIVCPIHGEFWQRPNDHLSGKGCLKCNESRLEREIRLLLDSKTIKYEKEKMFEWLGQKRLDFYLPKYNIAIECQGEQHFLSVEHFGGNENFKTVINNDKTKRKLCEEHGIKLLYYSDLKIDFPYEVITNKEVLIENINKS